jgi:deoxyhypusine synthase
VIILGGSVPKHHILNAHIWRNGADFGVFINTGIYEDGSDSGAKITEAFTWGKLRLNAKFSKVYSEATLVFPILVAETFAKRQAEASKL